MKKVTVIHYTKLGTKNVKPLNIGSFLDWIWSLTGAIFPALIIYMFIANGSPALLVSESHYECGYIDLLGGFYAKSIGGNCRWYGFREIQIIPTELNKIMEAN